MTNTAPYIVEVLMLKHIKDWKAAHGTLPHLQCGNQTNKNSTYKLREKVHKKFISCEFQTDFVEIHVMLAKFGHWN